MTPSTTASSEYFENPDWSPDALKLTLDTNAFPSLGANVLATISMSPLPTGPVVPAALWGAGAQVACASSSTGKVNQGHEYQPVYSPNNDSLAFTETACGSSQIEYTDPVSSGGVYKASTATAFQPVQDVLSPTNSPNACGPGKYNRLGASACKGISSEPDWQPIIATTQLPESPMAILLPIGGVALAALGLALRRRRAVA